MVGVARRAIGAVVARFVHTEEVTGSNPVSPTKSETGSGLPNHPQRPGDQLSDYAPEPPCPKSRSMTVAPVWMTGRIWCHAANVSRDQRNKGVPRHAPG